MSSKTTTKVRPRRLSATTLVETGRRGADAPSDAGGTSGTTTASKLRERLRHPVLA